MAPGLDPFAEQLVRRVNEYKRTHGEYANAAFWIKAVLLFGFWIISYVYLVFISPDTNPLNLILALAWGISSLLLVFNIGHDAVHGAISSKPGINNTFQYVFNLVGGCAYSWRLKHNLAHHMYTNVEGKDFDTELTPLMRLSSESMPLPHYRWQHFYFVLVYPLLSLLIIGIGDFKIFAQVKKAGIVKEHPASEYLILFLGKLFYLCLFFLAPHFLGGYSWKILGLVFLAIHAINGILIAVVFMPSHYFSGSRYYTGKEDTKNWFAHQLGTTQDMSPGNRVLGHFIGGLNLNVAHHTFPTFCHIHYFALSAIVESCAKEYGVSVHRANFFIAFYDHLRQLKKLGINA